MSHSGYRLIKGTTLIVVVLVLVAGGLVFQTGPIGGGIFAKPVMAQASNGVLAVVGANGASLYDRPEGDVVEELGIGTTLTAMGRSADSRWVMVTTDSSDLGWAEADSLVLFGIAQLPVMMGEVEDAEEQPATETPAAEEESEMDAAEDEAAVTEEPTKAPTATMTPSPTPVPPTATPTMTPTNTPSPTPEPTATFTPTPSPVPTATKVRASRSVNSTVIAVAGSRGAMLYDGPEGASIDELGIGTAMTADGRSEDEAWISVTTATGETGWVFVDEVVVFNVESLPVAESEATMAESDELEEESSDQEMSDSSGDDAEMADGAEELDAEMTGTDGSDDAAMTDEVAAEVDDGEVDDKGDDATPVAMPVPTREPRPTPVVADGDITASVALTGSRLNLRSGPGTGYGILGKAYPDEQFLAVGRNEDRDWILIEVPDIDAGQGWVSADLVLTSDPIVDLPVVEAGAMMERSGASDSTTGSNSESMGAEPTAEPKAEPEQPASNRPSGSVSGGPTGLSGKLVFTTGGQVGDIYVYDLDSNSLRFLTNGFEPAISRDGSKVAFTRYGSEPGIYAIDIDGSNERTVFGERVALTSPKWSPDGEWIVFSQKDGTYTCHNLGFGMCVDEGRFCPSIPGIGPINCLPNELKIELPEFALARVDKNGNEYLDLNALTTARAPSWNEGGIVYDSSTGIEITDDVDGSQTTNVVQERYYQDAEWQPNGDTIVFHSREGSHWEIFAINTDGTGLNAWTRPVTTLVENLPSNVAPAWSPDGTSVVYLSSRDDENDRGPWRLWVMDAGGGNQRPLPIDVPIEYGFGHDQIVSWGS